MSSTLIAHCGTQKISRDELRTIPAPPATATHKPIPHHDVVQALIETLGFELFANELSNVDSDGDLMILKGLEEFREHLGGQLAITMLKEIGSGFEVHEMNDAVVVESIQELQERHGQQALKFSRDKSPAHPRRHP